MYKRVAWDGCDGGLVQGRLENGKRRHGEAQSVGTGERGENKGACVLMGDWVKRRGVVGADAVMQFGSGGLWSE